MVIEAILIAVVFISLFGGIVLWRLAYPLEGFWRCRRCKVDFEATELATCPHCEHRPPHKYLGKEWKRW